MRHENNADEKTLLSGFKDLDETAFAAFMKQFKGLCNKCGKYGHKGADCKSGSGDKTKSSFKGNCNYCEESDSESDNDSYAELGFIATTKKKVTFNLEGSSSKKAAPLRNNKKKQKQKIKSSKSKIESILKGEKGLRCTIDGQVYPSFTKKTWFGDTGASCHITNDDSGMYEVESIDEPIAGIGRDCIRATKKGKKLCQIEHSDGTIVEKVLSPCKFAAEASDNLLSITAELSNGADLSKDVNNNIMLTYSNGQDIIFDRRLKTKDGWVAGVDVSTNQRDETAKSETVKKAKTKDVNELHCELGHPGEAATRATGKARGLKVTGSFKPCEGCFVGKAKKTNVSKEPNERSNIPGERLFIDISSPKQTSLGGKKHWLLALDDCTDSSWSWFMKKKDEQYTHLIGHIKDLKAKHNRVVKYIRCDNSGENRKLEELCKQEGLGITFEYTAPGTPQQNGRVERKFATLYGRIRAMLNDSGTEQPLRNKLWAEAANTSTILDNILISGTRDATPFQQFFGKGAKSIVPISTRKFGEMVVVTKNQHHIAKLKSRGETCIWLGYAANHAAGTYRIYNPRTRQVILSRDVHFLKETYGEYTAAKDKDRDVDLR
eukprot:scaffold11976_cov67-Skeletonema_dohrnii-CCMP3373.AAC.1